MNTKRVGIVLFENIEVLDFCGPFEVFSVTRLNEERRREEPSPFTVVLVAEKKRSGHGIRRLFSPTFTLLPDSVLPQ
jgi:hypothetical protein